MNIVKHKQKFIFLIENIGMPYNFYLKQILDIEK